jgi:hypothetical protein
MGMKNNSNKHKQTLGINLKVNQADNFKIMHSSKVETVLKFNILDAR